MPMLIKKTFYTLMIAAAALTAGSASAAPKIYAGKMRDADLVPSLPLEEHWQRAVKAYEEGDNREAVKHFNVLSVNSADSPEGQSANYYLGLCYYERQEYDWANEAFTRYIKGHGEPEHFEEAIRYKFAIAEHLRGGAKRRFYGTKHLPRWADGKRQALDIYDEVIVAMPLSDYAARALYAKGCLQKELQRYKDAVESLQAVVKRFPKHEMAPEAYLEINQVYLDQCKTEFQNPDLIAFAEMNVRRFRRDFPKEPRIRDAEQDVMRTKEVYAQGLYDIGIFYEKVKEPLASVIYYDKTVREFPETAVASKCRFRLSKLAPCLLEPEEEEDSAIEDFDAIEFTSLGEKSDDKSITDNSRGE